MRVFVTGATGFIGSVVVPELIKAGHQVIGLARSDASAAALVAAGAEVHRGSLEDLESLRSAASAADGVIHLGFIHDFTDYVASCEKDRRAIVTFGEALAGTGKALVVTSGTLLLPLGRLVTEQDSADLTGFGAARGKGEVAALATAERGVRVSIIRLPPTVHGEGDHGFVPALIGIAKTTGVSGYIGEGANRWPSVHRLDAARLYLLALEKAKAGTILHGVADEGIPILDIAGVIARRLKVETASKPADHFGWLAFALQGDNPTSSALTRESLGWTPTEPGLLADIDNDYYFKTA